MIRFEPDTWSDALLRFFAMAAPDANVYVEIAAPDLRFAALVLAAAALAVCWRRLVPRPMSVVALLASLLVATIPWLTTSGNGRYFMPMLVFVGPLVAGLLYVLPLTRSFRFFLAAGLLVAQGFVITQRSPFDAWAWLPWGQDGYFQVDAPKGDANAAPTTYVTLTSISYSLIAPQFPASSRWMNITTAGGLARDKAWALQFLEASKGPLTLIVPTIPGLLAPDGGPTPAVRKTLDDLLAPQRLALAPGGSCGLLHSRGLAAIGVKSPPPDIQAQIGFWTCPLKYPVERAPAQAVPGRPRADATFARIEQSCPRFFPPGSASTMPAEGGVVRYYGESDMKLYVLDDGKVLYKYWRALNPVLVGTVEGVLAGNEKVDCSHIPGRSGTPWERGI